MDFLLTDIRPAALEPPLSGKPPENAVPEFAALLRELPTNAAEPPLVEAVEVPEQVLVDINKSTKINNLMEDSEVSDQFSTAPPATLSAIAAALREPATTTPAAAMGSAASPQPAQATAFLGSESSQPPAVTGDVLPAGGSGLPPIAVSRQASAAAAVAPAQAASGPVADRVGTAAVAADLLPNADTVARNRAAPGSEIGHAAPAAPNRPASPVRAEPVAASVAALQRSAKSSISSSAAPAAAAEAPPGAGENLLAARASRLEAAPPGAPVAGSRPAPAAELASMPLSPEHSDSVSVTRPMAASGTERSALPRLMQAVDELPVPAPRDAAGATGPGTETVPMRTPVNEPAARVPGENLDPWSKALVSAGLDADADPQSLSRDASFVRGTELPQTAPTAQSPAAVTAPAALAQAVGGPQAAAQTAVLPPQLEALSIARDAPVTEWGDGIGERVSWLINQKQNAATIRLDPPALGRLEVQIRVADDATTITIQTQHGQTRDLIEAGAPRLREFLQEAGFQNVNVDVSQRQEQQQAGSQRQPDFEMAGDAEADGLEADSEWIRGGGRATYRSDNLVDTFA